MQETYYKKLDELSEIIMGQSPPSSSYNKENIGFPFFQGKSDFTSSYANPSTWCTNPLKTTRKDDILISVRAPVGPTNLSPDNACIGRGLAAIRPNPKALDKFYLLHFLKKIEKNISALGTGSTFKAINKHQLSSIKIPLQSLPTQKKIAEILTKAESTLQKRREAIKLLDEYLKSVFLEVFGDLNINSKKWNVRKFAELGEWTSGGTPSRLNHEYFHGDIDWYSAGELNERYLHGSKEKINLQAIKESSTKLFSSESLLIGMYDTAAFKLGILIKNSAANQACANIKPNKDLCDIDWFYSALQYMKSYFLLQRRGVRQKNLNLGMIKNFSLPLPPLNKQQEFASVVKKIESLKQKMKDSEKELDVLFKALMQRSFRGEGV